MTFTTTIIARTVYGNKKVVIGSTANDGTTGDVVTGLASVDMFIPTPLGGTAAEISVDETFPFAGGAISVVAESSVNFGWIAYGR